MNVMVVGSGGREHALVWKLSQSRKVSKIFAVPGNAGTAQLAVNVALDPTNAIEIADFAQAEEVQLTVVGPELPLGLGIVDEFKRRNLNIFGPSQKAAYIETSKAFAKQFMSKHNIPTAEFSIFNDIREAANHIKSATFPVVVKTDGLAGGKGVFICRNMEDGMAALQSIMQEKKFGRAGEQVIIEDFLPGQEMSFMVVSDGKRVIPLVTAMDYKKAGEKDTGPNTGGMGAISPAPDMNRDLLDSILRTIIMPTIEGLRFEGREFRGVLYAGLMITRTGPVVLEFNVRFGDPETQAVLLRMKSDLVDLLTASAEGSLFDVHIDWEEEVSACVVLTSRGYPGGYEKDKPISGLERAKSMGVEIFHAGTRLEGETVYSTGGRVLNVCARAAALKDAMKKIYDAIPFITYDNISFRSDIGRKQS